MVGVMCNFCKSSEYYPILRKVVENIYKPPMYYKDNHWDAFGQLMRDLGYDNYDFQFMPWSSTVERKMELLAGPHGYAMWKVMKVKKRMEK